MGQLKQLYIQWCDSPNSANMRGRGGNRMRLSSWLRALRQSCASTSACDFTNLGSTCVRTVVALPRLVGLSCSRSALRPGLPFESHLHNISENNEVIGPPT